MILTFLLSEYGLKIKSKKSINFEDFAEYECIKDDYVIDSGFIFNLKCLPSGKFQSKEWQQCRKRKYCTKTPPYPPKG